MLCILQLAIKQKLFNREILNISFSIMKKYTLVFIHCRIALKKLKKCLH